MFLFQVDSQLLSMFLGNVFQLMESYSVTGHLQNKIYVTGPN